jgi:hypothetical protein
MLAYNSYLGAFLAALGSQKPGYPLQLRVPRTAAPKSPSMAILELGILRCSNAVKYPPKALCTPPSVAARPHSDCAGIFAEGRNAKHKNRHGGRFLCQFRFYPLRGCLIWNYQNLQPMLYFRLFACWLFTVFLVYAPCKKVSRW